METILETPTSSTVAGTSQFEARPIAWRIGSEIMGIDLKRTDDISDESIRQMWQLLGQRGILLFRQQGLNHDQHLAFTRRFGALAVTGLTSRYAPPGYPDIFTVTNIKTNGARSETENAAQQWHSDQTFLRVPARASMLRCGWHLSMVATPCSPICTRSMKICRRDLRQRWSP